MENLDKYDMIYHVRPAHTTLKLNHNEHELFGYNPWDKSTEHVTGYKVLNLSGCKKTYL